MVTSII